MSSKISVAAYEKIAAGLNLKLIDPFTHMTKRIRHQCVLCGSIAPKLPHSVVAGRGCKNCADSIARKTPKTYAGEALAIGVEPLEPYVGAKVAIRHKCLKCNHVWLKQPNKILTGTGCAKCVHASQRLSLDVYSKRISARFCGSIGVIASEDEFTSTQRKYEHICFECGNIWKGRPAFLMSAAFGCPRCAALSAKKKEEVYIDELLKANPTIKLIGSYQGSGTKTLHKHDCGYQWMVRPNHILSLDSSCPVCCDRSVGRSSGIYGIVTEACGRSFPSKLEASCATDLAAEFGLGDIEFGKIYAPPKQFNCDFYIRSLDLWIEVSSFCDEAYLAKIFFKRGLVKNFVFANTTKQIMEMVIEFRNRGH